MSKLTPLIDRVIDNYNQAMYFNFTPATCMKRAATINEAAKDMRSISIQSGERYKPALEQLMTVRLSYRAWMLVAALRAEDQLVEADAANDRASQTFSE